jgi:hypothetical protein
MRASNLLRGSLAIRRVKLPLACAPAAPGEAGLEHDSVPEVGLRALSGHETALVLQRAREFAVSRGVADPKPDDELYEFGKAVHTCLVGVVDPDAPPERAEPFFDGGLQQLLSLPGLGRDEILMLAELQEQWQSEVSPGVKDIAPEAFEQALEQLAGPAGGTFFFSLRPGTRLSFTRTMAGLLLLSLRGRSPSGSTPTAPPSSDWEDPEPEPSAPAEPRPRLRLKRPKGRRR